MRSICKKGTVALAAVMMFAAVASASASASSWWVAGQELGSSTAELAATTNVTEHFTLRSAAGLTIECTGTSVGLTKGSISSANGGKIEHLKFSGCAMLTKDCSLAGKNTIETEPLTAEAALGAKSPEDSLVLKPTSGTTFLEYNVGGESCPSGGIHKVTGKMTLGLPTGRDELGEQELTANAEEGELNHQEYIKGKFKAKLASGKAWSFH